MDIFVARQPIFNRKKEVIAYELLYRDSPANFFSGAVSGSKATSILLANSYFTIGISNLIEDKKAFINFDKVLLNNSIPLLLDKEKVVIEILETVEPDATLISQIEDFKKRGYTIALDDFTIHYPHQEIIDLSDIIKVDFIKSTPSEIKAIMKKYKNRGIEFVAEKVESHREYKLALDLGFDYFQGYFFSKPVVIKSKALQSMYTQFLRVYKELNTEEPDYIKIASVIEENVDMSYKLLRLVNSYTLLSEITSIRHALSMVGLIEIRNWLNLIFLTSTCEGSPNEILRLSLVRSKFAELICDEFGLRSIKYEVSLAGLFSMLDALLERPLDSILDELKISDDIKNAIHLNPKSRLYSVYKIVIDYETGDWDELADDMKSMNIDTNLSALYFKAIKSTNSLLDIIYPVETEKQNCPV